MAGRRLVITASSNGNLFLAISKLRALGYRPKDRYERLS